MLERTVVRRQVENNHFAFENLNPIPAAPPPPPSLSEKHALMTLLFQKERSKVTDTENKS